MHIRTRTLEIWCNYIIFRRSPNPFSPQNVICCSDHLITLQVLLGIKKVISCVEFCEKEGRYWYLKMKTKKNVVLYCPIFFKYAWSFILIY